MAKEFGISCTRVCQIGQQVDKWLTPQLMDSIREIKARHTSCLMRVFQEAMAAWTRSKLPAESQTTTDGRDGLDTTRRTVGQVGNPAFLSEARAALADIRRMWGAEAPIAMPHSGEMRLDGMPPGAARRQYALGRIAKYQKFLNPHEN